MRDFVHMMVKQSWIEGTVGPNKRPGAYCTGFQKSRTPRVYMTYTGGQSDVITLAHELGHALHSWMMRDLPLSQSRYGMSLAETASTFGETLVRDTLLSSSTSLQQQLDISWEDMGAFTAFLLNIPTPLIRSLVGSEKCIRDRSCSACIYVGLPLSDLLSISMPHLFSLAPLSSAFTIKAAFDLSA